MGSSSSCNHNHTDNINHEKFNFRFTDCSCQCTANKKLVNNNEQSQTMIFNALMKSTIRPQYDISMAKEKIFKKKSFLLDLQIVIVTVVKVLN